MTKEKYNKVCDIYNAIKSLESVKDVIDNGKRHNFLTYGYRLGDDLCIHSSAGLSAIGLILKRHDEEIRHEIDEEIKRLEKEIEKL